MVGTQISMAISEVVWDNNGERRKEATKWHIKWTRLEGNQNVTRTNTHICTHSSSDNSRVYTFQTHRAERHTHSTPNTPTIYQMVVLVGLCVCVRDRKESVREGLARRGVGEEREKRCTVPR